jgi:hypothetical protein
MQQAQSWLPWGGHCPLPPKQRLPAACALQVYLAPGDTFRAAAAEQLAAWAKRSGAVMGQFRWGGSSSSASSASGQMHADDGHCPRAASPNAAACCCHCGCREGGKPGGVLAACCNDAKQRKDIDLVGGWGGRHALRCAGLRCAACRAMTRALRWL